MTAFLDVRHRDGLLLIVGPECACLATRVLMVALWSESVLYCRPATLALGRSVGAGFQRRKSVH